MNIAINRIAIEAKRRRDALESERRAREAEINPSWSGAVAYHWSRRRGARSGDASAEWFR